MSILSEVRIAQQLTQQDVADKFKCSKWNISAFENGRNNNLSLFFFYATIASEMLDSYHIMQLYKTDSEIEDEIVNLVKNKFLKGIITDRNGLVDADFDNSISKIMKENEYNAYCRDYEDIR